MLLGSTRKYLFSFNVDLGAAVIENLSVSLSDTTINAQPTVTVTGSADFDIPVGSCFKV